MKIGKWYIAFRGMCFGFGTPPAHLWEQRIDRGDR